MPERELNGKQRRHLRALAHDLKPVVLIGVQGVNDGILKAIQRALETHELIKVRVASEGSDPGSVGEQVAGATGAHLAQVIGRMLVLYRRRKNKPTLVLPGEKPPRERAGANLARTATLTRKKKRKAKARRVRRPAKREE